MPLPVPTPAKPQEKTYQFREKISVPGLYRILRKSGMRFVESPIPSHAAFQAPVTSEPPVIVFDKGEHVFTLHHVEPAGVVAQAFYANKDGWGFLAFEIARMTDEGKIMLVSNKRPP